MWNYIREPLEILVVGIVAFLILISVGKGLLDALYARRRRQAQQYFKWLEETGNGKDRTNAR